MNTKQGKKLLLRDTKVNGTVLDDWILRRIDRDRGEMILSGDVLGRYHLRAIQEIVDYARTRSPFYRRHLKRFCGTDIRALHDVSALPFTTAEDLREQGLQFLCVSQDEIERVITLETSGTMDKPKRVYFTGEDLEATIDFFHHGMTMFVQPGQKVLILLPGAERPNSAADLLEKGLARLGSRGIRYGAMRDPEPVLEFALRHAVDAMVGIPTQMLALARGSSRAAQLRGRLKLVILCSDHVPEAIVAALRKRWDCRIVSHYGSTEMGLGGGIECESGSGYHFREGDLYVEIVDPATGKPAPEGAPGELVVTTLTRKGMPLIRYRTGDRSRILAGPCSCGSVLRRLEKITGRITPGISQRDRCDFSMSDLDEALFPIAGVINFTADVRETSGGAVLRITVQAPGGAGEALADQVREALAQVPAIRRAVRAGDMVLDVIWFSETHWLPASNQKRRIVFIDSAGEAGLSSATENTRGVTKKPQALRTLKQNSMELRNMTP